jgi:hypothetical protein
MPSFHRRLSRWMGPLPQPKPGVGGWLILAALAGAVGFVLVTHPIGTLLAIAAIATLAVVGERQRARSLLPRASERAREDIGSFTRAFDRRAAPFDPWAVRAVWNTLVPLTETCGRTIPLRPSDRFDADLGLDPDDLEDLIPPLVEQCERVGGNWKANPYYDRLTTVGDLVRFISAQPLRRSA